MAKATLKFLLVLSIAPLLAVAYCLPFWASVLFQAMKDGWKDGRFN